MFVSKPSIYYLFKIICQDKLISSSLSIEYMQIKKKNNEKNQKNIQQTYVFNIKRNNRVLEEDYFLNYLYENDNVYKHY